MDNANGIKAPSSWSKPKPNFFFSLNEFESTGNGTILISVMQIKPLIYSTANVLIQSHLHFPLFTAVRLLCFRDRTECELSMCVCVLAGSWWLGTGRFVWIWKRARLHTCAVSWSVTVIVSVGTHHLHLSPLRGKNLAPTHPDLQMTVTDCDLLHKWLIKTMYSIMCI